MDLRSLLSCLSVAIVPIAIWGHVPLANAKQPHVRSLALGLILGLAAIGSMLVPIQVEAGMIFDFRSPLLATAGVVGGPVATVVAWTLALGYRAMLGGSGAFIGCLGITVVALLGSVAYQVRLRAGASTRWLPVLAAAVAITSFVLICLLGRPWARSLSEGSLMAGINFACTWLFPLSLLREAKLHQLHGENWIYRTIIEKLPDSLNAKDVEGRFLAANPATARLMQVATPDGLIGRSDADFYPADMAAGFREEERRVLAGEVVGPVDQEVSFSDGSRRWLTSMKSPLRDATGRVRGIITHNRDVTDRKRLEAELARAQGYLQEAMANMADGLVLYDRDGVIRFCNQQYRDLFPGTADLRIVGARFADIIRASVVRGEEAPTTDVEAWIEQRSAGLRVSGDRLIGLADGRTIEARTRPLAGGDTLVVFSDATSRRRRETELLHRASHDPLTGLPNRAEYEFQLASLRERVAASGEPMAVMMLDLDKFKRVNDTLGHAAGDAMLVEVGKRLRAAVRSHDLVARLGGDEFAFLMVGSDVALGAERLAARVVLDLQRPFRFRDIELKPGGSIGVAVMPRDADDVDGLVALADAALYDAKRNGGGVRFAGPRQDPAPIGRDAAA